MKTKTKGSNTLIKRLFIENQKQNKNKIKWGTYIKVKVKQQL